MRVAPTPMYAVCRFANFKFFWRVPTNVLVDDNEHTDDMPGYNELVGKEFRSHVTALQKLGFATPEHV